MANIYYKNNSEFIPITYYDVGAAPSIHTHTISDFNGILSISKNGTGANLSNDPVGTVYYFDYYNNSWATVTNPSTISGTTSVPLIATAANTFPLWGIAPIEAGGSGVNTEYDLKALSGKYKYPGDTITISPWLIFGSTLTNSKTDLHFSIRLPYIFDNVSSIYMSGNFYFIGQGTRIPSSGTNSINSNSTNPTVTLSWTDYAFIKVKFHWSSALSFPSNNDTIITHATNLSFTLS